MKLSTKVRYGVRALMDIAEHSLAGPVSLKDVARRQGISEQYLEQLILPLKGAGVVRSVRGAHGGFVLSKRAADIRISEVVEILGGTIALIDCLYNQEVCLRADCCGVRDLWQEANEAFKNVLASVTLADLLHRQQRKLEHLREKKEREAKDEERA
uniref:Rrf2 family transcriptional regulator n=1 Tax=Ammonifex degensii TaxID=42838 RepID=A0A7C2IDN1_9THEO